VRRCSATIVVVGKQFVLYTLRVCVYLYLSSMQCACVMLYCHLWPLWFYNIFPHYLTNGTIFGGEITEHKMCVYITSTSFVWNISHSKNNCDSYDKKINIGLQLKCPSLSSDFNEAWIFPTDFQKISENFQISWKPVQCEPSCSMRAGGRTDRQAWWRE